MFIGIFVGFIESVLRVHGRNCNNYLYELRDFSLLKIRRKRNCVEENQANQIACLT